MNRRLANIAAQQCGVFTTAQALACGYDEDTIHDLARHREWQRLRRGSYAAHEVYQSLDAVGRHKLLVHAVVASYREHVAISHTSAVVLHGLPTWGLDLSHVHVTRLDKGASRIERDVHHHVGEVTPDEVVRIDGVQLMRADRAVIETAAISPFESGVVVADAALAALVTAEQLYDRLDRIRTWPGARTVSAVVPFADGRSESVGESLLRVVCFDEELPEPELQVEIRDLGGSLVGRVDMLFRKQWTIVEFDGRLKYAGDEDGRTLFAEKRREDRLRELGYEVVRITWADLQHPRRVAARIRRAFERAAARHSRA